MVISQIHGVQIAFAPKESWIHNSIFDLYLQENQTAFWCVSPLAKELWNLAVDIQNNHPTTRIPGPSANLVKCTQQIDFTLDYDGVFLDHRGISFCISKVGKDIINATIKAAWNYVISKQVAFRKEWSFVKDYH